MAPRLTGEEHRLRMLGALIAITHAVTLSSGPRFNHLSEGSRGNPFDFLGCCGQKLVKTMSSVLVRKKPRGR